MPEETILSLEQVLTHLLNTYNPEDADLKTAPFYVRPIYEEGESVPHAHRLEIDGFQMAEIPNTIVGEEAGEGFANAINSAGIHLERLRRSVEHWKAHVKAVDALLDAAGIPRTLTEGGGRLLTEERVARALAPSQDALEIMDILRDALAAAAAVEGGRDLPNEPSQAMVLHSFALEKLIANRQRTEALLERMPITSHRDAPMSMQVLRSVIAILVTLRPVDNGWVAHSPNGKFQGGLFRNAEPEHAEPWFWATNDCEGYHYIDSEAHGLEKLIGTLQTNGFIVDADAAADARGVR